MHRFIHYSLCLLQLQVFFELKMRKKIAQNKSHNSLHVRTSYTSYMVMVLISTSHFILICACLPVSLSSVCLIHLRLLFEHRLLTCCLFTVAALLLQYFAHTNQRITIHSATLGFLFQRAKDKHKRGIVTVEEGKNNTI